MRTVLILLLFGIGMAAGCQPAPAADPRAEAAGAEASRPASPVGAEPVSASARGPEATPDLGEASTVCQRFARRVAELARRSPTDHETFLQALQDEVVGGTGDPFELENGLREGTWNQSYFYAGGGGFRPEFDDADRYPRGGNHQPGHFIAVLSIAAQFGEENARVAIAHAGDYGAGDEDDLRLSGRAIELGTALAGSAISPGQVATEVRALCR